MFTSGEMPGGARAAEGGPPACPSDGCRKSSPHLPRPSALKGWMGAQKADGGVGGCNHDPSLGSEEHFLVCKGPLSLCGPLILRKCLLQAPLGSRQGRNNWHKKKGWLSERGWGVATVNTCWNPELFVFLPLRSSPTSYCRRASLSARPALLYLPLFLSISALSVK